MARKKKGAKQTGGTVASSDGKLKAVAGCQSSGKVPTIQGAKKGFQKRGGGADVGATGSRQTPSPSETLPAKEQAFLEDCVTLKVPAHDGADEQSSYRKGFNNRSGNQKAEEAALVEQAGGMLEQFHMCVVQNALSSAGQQTPLWLFVCVFFFVWVSTVFLTLPCVFCAFHRDARVLPSDLDVIQKEYLGMLDFKGDSAIGEKDATKRSASRM